MRFRSLVFLKVASIKGVRAAVVLSGLAYHTVGSRFESWTVSIPKALIAGQQR
jgi:hypothetical protein